MLPLPVILESQDDMSVVDGTTIEQRIRISRPSDENTRCRVSSARGQLKDFSQLTQPPTTLSTSNVISLLQGPTEPFAGRLRTCGARQSRSFENIRDACSSFNDVTTPNQALYAENQRKSRTLHSDGAARMGLRKGGNIGGYASDNTLLKTNARLITLEFLERE